MELITSLSSSSGRFVANPEVTQRGDVVNENGVLSNFISGNTNLHKTRLHRYFRDYFRIAGYTPELSRCISQPGPRVSPRQHASQALRSKTHIDLQAPYVFAFRELPDQPS